MDNIPIDIISKIGDYLPLIDRINLYLTKKECYKRFFYPNKENFKNKYVNTYKLCTICFKRCYLENTIITLCKCLGNYSMRHYNCSIIMKN